MLPNRVDPTSPTAAQDVVAFWRDAGPSRWFRKDPAFDDGFRERFADLHDAAAAGRLVTWNTTAEGTLALLVLLDQFPRNAFRDSPRMFATDAVALGIAREGIDRGFDQQTEPALRRFFYLPFMHSEHLDDQRRSVTLSRTLGDGSVDWAQVHLDVIERFGRFPHRNAVLGRTTSPDEQKFLDEGGFSG